MGRSGLEWEGLGESGKVWVRVGRSGLEWEGLGKSGKVWVRVGRSGYELASSPGAHRRKECLATLSHSTANDSRSKQDLKGLRKAHYSSTVIYVV